MRIRSVTLLAVTAVASGCAESAPTPPAVMSRVSSTAHSTWSKKGVLPGTNPNAANTNGIGQALVCSSRLTGTDSALIGSSGGQLAVGRNRLIVPAGALRDPVWIRMTVPESANAVIELEPSGLVFRKPAGLQLDVEGCGTSPAYVPDVHYVDHDGNILERIPALYSSLWHTIAAAIDHFSGYIVAM